ncbi:hypothetical protein A0H81_11252 [Grifola frondosa]|uniref:Uncharacterized protein n=1 Tax=Grifola frondosa TaxID=5627 RepID=A0A1C7LVE8_GRIFR|nr:hypothetical protein A0H81_11252 [Grifola frondosa]
MPAFLLHLDWGIFSLGTQTLTPSASLLGIARVGSNRESLRLPLICASASINEHSRENPTQQSLSAFLGHPCTIEFKLFTHGFGICCQADDEDHLESG